MYLRVAIILTDNPLSPIPKMKARAVQNDGVTYSPRLRGVHSMPRLRVQRSA